MQQHPTQPYGEQVLDSLGMSSQAAALAYASLGLAPAAVQAVIVNRAINLQSAANAWVRGTYTGQSAITYEGTVYRFTDPKYSDVAWEIHSGNVEANYRYSPPGVGAIYSGTAPHTARAEITSYQNGLDGKVLVSGNTVVENILDLTNPAALRALGVTKQEIVLSSHGANGSYTQTQRIAEWAREQGYNGILAPSAQTKTGTNLITFDSTKVSKP